MNIGNKVDIYIEEGRLANEGFRFVCRGGSERRKIS